jgi:CBS domain-containing protein
MPVTKLLQRPVLTLSPEASCMQAARVMDAEGVDAVVVSLEGRPLGMVTARDLAVRVMAQGRGPKDVLLREVMSGTPFYLSEQRGLDEYIGMMCEMAVRRMMVVDAEGRLVGVLTLDDLLLLLTDQLGGLATVVRRSVTSPTAHRRPQPPAEEPVDED